MVHLREVLRALRGAGLTANPKKCAIGRVEVRYLGFHLGHGQVRPQIDKTAAIAACPRPKTKKEVRQFLGLAGYYRRFIPDYSELTSPLTDLTKKEVPDTVPWTERCQQVFTQVKAALCGGPLLHSPDFSLPFLLQTDASDRGPGAGTGGGGAAGRRASRPESGGGGMWRGGRGSAKSAAGERLRRQR